MKRFLLAVALVTAPAALAGGEECHGGAQAAAAVNKVTVKQVAEWAKTKAVTAVDANGKEVREKYGVIPGAVLLSSSGQFDVKELPSDKASRLVFYCFDDRCTASESAAQRAQAHGYINVSVLPGGITAWIDGGQPKERPRS